MIIDGWLVMDTVMILQTMEGASLMVEIVVDQMLIRNIVQNVSAMQIWTVWLHWLWLATVSAMMKPILQSVAMMEVIAAKTAPIQIFVVNVHAMRIRHRHLMYHVKLKEYFPNLPESTLYSTSPTYAIIVFSKNIA
jgi:hypothetical protein